MTAASTTVAVDVNLIRDEDILMTEPLSAAELVRLNQATSTAFVSGLGSLYEHSPWVAERAAAMRPFASALDMHRQMDACVRLGTRDEQLGLIRAHPELAGREAIAGTLTDASTSEQARFGNYPDL